MLKEALDINCKIGGNKFCNTHVDHLPDGKEAIQETESTPFMLLNTSSYKSIFGEKKKKKEDKN